MSSLPTEQPFNVVVACTMLDGDGDLSHCLTVADDLLTNPDITITEMRIVVYAFSHLGKAEEPIKGKLRDFLNRHVQEGVGGCTVKYQVVIDQNFYQNKNKGGNFLTTPFDDSTIPTAYIDVSAPALTDVTGSKRIGFLPKDQVLHIGEFGATEYRDDWRQDGSNYCHMGFHRTHCGIWLTNPPESPVGAEELDSEKLKDFFNKLDFIDKHSEHILFIPAYCHNQDFFERVMQQLLASEYAAGFEHIVVLHNPAVGNSEVMTEGLGWRSNQRKLDSLKPSKGSGSKTVTFIDTNKKLTEDDFIRIWQLANGVGICGGDNTLQLCLSNGLIPLMHVPHPKRQFWRAFVSLLRSKFPNTRGVALMDALRRPIERITSHTPVGFFVPSEDIMWNGPPSLVGMYLDRELTPDELVSISDLSKETVGEWTDVCDHLRQHHNFRDYFRNVALPRYLSSRLPTPASDHQLQNTSELTRLSQRLKRFLASCDSSSRSTKLAVLFALEVLAECYLIPEMSLLNIIEVSTLSFMVLMKSMSFLAIPLQLFVTYLFSQQDLIDTPEDWTSWSAIIPVLTKLMLFTAAGLSDMHFQPIHNSGYVPTVDSKDDEISVHTDLDYAQ